MRKRVHNVILVNSTNTIEEAAIRKKKCSSQIKTKGT